MSGYNSGKLYEQETTIIQPVKVDKKVSKVFRKASISGENEKQVTEKQVAVITPQVIPTPDPPAPELVEMEEDNQSQETTIEETEDVPQIIEVIRRNQQYIVEVPEEEFQPRYSPIEPSYSPNEPEYSPPSSPIYPPQESTDPENQSNDLDILQVENSIPEERELSPEKEKGSRRDSAESEVLTTIQTEGTPESGEEVIPMSIQTEGTPALGEEANQESTTRNKEYQEFGGRYSEDVRNHHYEPQKLAVLSILGTQTPFPKPVSPATTHTTQPLLCGSRGTRGFHP